MSFDIFLQCFCNGEPEPIPRELFESIFLPHATHLDSYKEDRGYMTVEYSDGSAASIYCGGDEGEEETSHMMFDHCGGDSFWADLYRLAERTQSVIFWPAVLSFRIFTNEAAVAHLPKDFLGADDIVRFIRSGAEITGLINESFPEEAMKQMYGDFWPQIVAAASNGNGEPKRLKAKRRSRVKKGPPTTRKNSRTTSRKVRKKK